MTEYKLKYGCNPNQNPARIHMDGQALPFQILNGAAGYINLLDAFNSWQLVRELKAATGLPSAASQRSEKARRICKMVSLQNRKSILCRLR